MHFYFFSVGGGPEFDFVGFLLKERERKRGFVMGSCWWCGGVHTIGKGREGLGWVSIWGKSEMGGAQRREEQAVISGFSWGGSEGEKNGGRWGEERGKGLFGSGKKNFLFLFNFDTS